MRLSEFAALLLILYVASANAQRHRPCEEKDPSRRCLGGHLFVPSRAIEAPFLTTNFSTYLYGQTGTLIGNFDQTTRKFPSRQAVAGGVNYSLQVAILDWLAVFGSFSAGGSAGLNQSFIAFGAGGDFAYDGGVRFRLWQNDRFLLSTSARFEGTGSSGIKPLDVIRNMPNVKTSLGICLGQATTPAERRNQKNACLEVQRAMTSVVYDLGGRIDASIAIGISPVMGIWFNLGYNHFFRSGTHPLDFKAVVDADLGYSLDISTITPVPIGFLVGVQYAYRFDYITRFDQDVGALTARAGIFYTGSPQFSVGLEISGEISPVLVGDAVERASLFSVSANLRYYWN